MKISRKYLDICLTDSKVDVLEGQTASGKTTTMASTKFLYMVEKTKEKRHLIAGKDLGTIVSNIVSTGSYGIVDNFPQIEQCLKGDVNQPLPHLKINDNIIFLCGYDDVSKWKKMLGKQFGAILIDECNIADINFIRELFLPRFEYALLTLNPDNPKKDIYNEIINRSRPTEKYKNEVPSHIMKELEKSPPHKDWNYWFCKFEDNPSMTKERIEELKGSLLPETREYQTKILGIRTVGTGLVMPLKNTSIINEAKAKEFKYQLFSCGVDTSYSSNSEDTVSILFMGLTTSGKLIALEEETHNNKDKTIPFSPSDVAVMIDNFFTNCCRKWGVTKSMFIDNADIATTTEVQKFARNNFRSYYPTSAWKKTPIIDRINLMNSWIKNDYYLIVDNCKQLIDEHNCYVWDSDKDKPQDGNDHSINALQYSWLPYKSKIGVEVDEL